MAKVVIGDEPKEVLEVEIKGDVYRIPLPSTLTFSELKKINKVLKAGDDQKLDWAERFFTDKSRGEGRFIPKEVFEQLSVGNIIAIVNAWRGAAEESDTKPGES